MNAKNSGLQHSLTSALARVDAHPIGEGGYDELPELPELPELDEATLARAVLRRDEQPEPARVLDKNVPFNVRLAQGV